MGPMYEFIEALLFWSAVVLVGLLVGYLLCLGIYRFARLLTGKKETLETYLDEAIAKVETPPPEETPKDGEVRHGEAWFECPICGDLFATPLSGPRSNRWEDRKACRDDPGGWTRKHDAKCPTCRIKIGNETLVRRAILAKKHGGLTREQCFKCGHVIDYEVDDACPNCGAGTGDTGGADV